MSLTAVTGVWVSANSCTTLGATGCVLCHTRVTCTLFLSCTSTPSFFYVLRNTRTPHAVSNNSDGCLICRAGTEISLCHNVPLVRECPSVKVPGSPRITARWRRVYKDFTGNRLMVEPCVYSSRINTCITSTPCDSFGVLSHLCSMTYALPTAL